MYRCIDGFKANIQLDTNANQIISRHVPPLNSMKPKIEEQLDKLVMDGGDRCKTVGEQYVFCVVFIVTVFCKVSIRNMSCVGVS